MLPRSASMRILLSLLILITLAATSFAVAPSREAIEKWKADGTYDQKIAAWKNFRANGGSEPSEHPVISKDKTPDRMALGAAAVDTVRVLVIMVDFNDWPWTGNRAAGTAADFDSILFSDRENDLIVNPTGSMTDYYLENSYGNFYIEGDVVGWYRMPMDYTYYMGPDSIGLGAASFPNNAQYLALHAVQHADNDGVDFSQYDYKGDGYCDGVIIIHSGPGPEIGERGIWSHKWNLYTDQQYDGVWVSDYTMNPEEYGYDLSPIGVFCHEYGHFIGLPDLYDISDETGESQGLGHWSVMASGSYNGNSQRPAHFDSWCKNEVGFIQLIDVVDNMYRVEIPQIEDQPVAYKLSNGIAGSDEYWIVENRQKVGFDVGLPGNGLLIYHIDEGEATNSNPYNYMVALEQADGEDQLAFGGSIGDVGDPFPGFVDNRNFHDLTTPAATTYASLPTRIGVWNISDAGEIMTVDLDISYSRPYVVLSGSDSLVIDDSQSGDGNGLFEAGETVQMYFKVKNLMLPAYNAHAHLSPDNPDLEFVTNDITIPGIFSPTESHNALYPIEFTLPDTLDPRIDSFYLTITADSVDGVLGGENYSTRFGFEAPMGKPNILVVDDDDGSDWEEVYRGTIYNKRVPTAVWHTDIEGTPSGAELSQYQIVFWHTGPVTGSPSIDMNDINAMRDYLDGNGNLLLSSATAANEMHDLDSAFMADYFKVSVAGTMQHPEYVGVTGNPVGDGTSYFTTIDNFYTCPTFTVMPGGEAAFTIKGPDINGVTYSGSYRTVFVSFGIEFIDDGVRDSKDTLLTRVVDFFGGFETDVYDGRSFVQLPTNFDLGYNYPNPFNPTTSISYTLRAVSSSGVELARTKLAIFNMLGRKVKTLVDEVQIPGTYTVEWDGTAAGGKKVASGIYFYRLSRGDEAETRKMMLLK